MKKNFTRFNYLKAYALMLGLFMLLLPSLGYGQIAAWDFFGQSSPTSFAATTFNSNLLSASSANNITRGAGAASSSGGNSFRTVGFQNNGISTANTDYFQITLQAASGYKVSLSTIDANFVGTASFYASPGVTSQFAYSLNGTTFTLIGSAVQSTSLTMTQIDLSGISALQNVVNGTTITIRYYASGQTTTGGWGFSSTASGTNGLAIGGTVASASTPTKLVITGINPTSPTVGSGFSVTVQSQDGSNIASNVSATTGFSLTTNGNAGVIGGTTTGSITSGSNSVTVTGVTLPSTGTGVTLTATRTSGDVLTAGTSATFSVLAAASQLAFGTSPPSTGNVGVNLTSFTVEARRPDNSVDNAYTGNITISIASGAGTLSGTTTVAAVAGVATFSTLQLSAEGTNTLTASASGLTGITSGNITVSLVNSTVVSWSNTSNTTAYHTGSNWSSSSVPTGSVVAQWNNTGSATTCSINVSTASPSILGIEVTDLRTRVLTLGNSVNTNGTLTLNGGIINGIQNVILRNNSDQLLTLQDNGGGTGLLGVMLGNTTDNIININGTGGITISSIISGSSRKLTKAGSGTGILTLTGANTYTGLTTVSAGTLKLNRTGGTTIPVGNSATVTGGTLQISTNQTLVDLIVNGGAVTVDDGVTLTITGTLTLTSGKITLGTGNIIAAAVSGGSASSYVVTTGTGKLTINAVTSATFPIGPTASAYNPVTIAAGGGFNYAVNVSATAPTGTGVAQPSAAISRQWDISPNGAPTNVSLTFQYNSGEGVTGAFSPTGSLDGMHFNGTRWDYIGNSTGTGASPYMVAFTYAGPTWSPFSFGNAGILPTELTALKAKAQKGQNLLTWQTATEKNSDHFDIQRSSSTQANWQTISTVKAAGNSQTLKAYQFVDDAPLSISYYRLRQVDFDGKESLSNIVSVINSASGKLKIYPTIVQDKLTISLDSNEPQIFNIYNLLGQNVQTGQLTGQKELIISQLSTGTYFLKAHGETVKFVKN